MLNAGLEELLDRSVGHAPVGTDHIHAQKAFPLDELGADPLNLCRESRRVDHLGRGSWGRQQDRPRDSAAISCPVEWDPTGLASRHPKNWPTLR